MPKLSICIPTYNRAIDLRRCLESVLSTQDRDIEVVVQDNCSPDQTEQIISSFCDTRIKYYKNDKNIGMVLNIISIIEKATGDFIFFLTDDDCMLPGSIAKVKAFIEKGVDCFTTDAIMYLEKQKQANTYSYFNSNIITCHEDKEKITQIFLSSHILSRCCFKRNLIDIEFLKVHGDNWYPHMLIVLLFYLRSARIGYLAEPIVMHTWENETFWGVSPYNFKELHQGQVNIIMSVYPQIDEEMFNCLVYNFSIIKGYIHEDFNEILTVEKKKEILYELKKIEIKKQNSEVNASILKIANKKTFIWGTGKAAQYCYDVLLKRGLGEIVIGFIENNPLKWNSCFNKKKIYSPSALHDIKDTCMVLIGSMYYSEIGIELEQLGFEKVNDKVFLLRKETRHNNK